MSSSQHDPAQHPRGNPTNKGQFAVVTRQDPGDVLSLSERLPAVSSIRVVEPFNPTGMRRPFLWGKARRDVINRLQIDNQTLIERTKIAARHVAQLNDARMLLLTGDQSDGEPSRSTFEQAVELQLFSQSAVDSARRNVAEGEWKLGTDTALAA